MLNNYNTVFLAEKKLLKHKSEKNMKYGLFELFNIRREQIHSLLSSRVADITLGLYHGFFINWCQFNVINNYLLLRESQTL